VHSHRWSYVQILVDLEFFTACICKCVVGIIGNVSSLKIRSLDWFELKLSKSCTVGSQVPYFLLTNCILHRICRNGVCASAY